MKRILLDECVPWPLAKLLVGNDCTSPQKKGWGGVKNGDLLHLASAEFDLFITSDQNLRYQQNLDGRTIAIIELSTNDWHSIKANVEVIRTAVEQIRPSDFVRLTVSSVE
jgi:hypothetical protein